MSFVGYVCEEHRDRLKNESVIFLAEVGKGEPDPTTDAPMECIYCGCLTNDIFVELVNF